MLLMRSLGARFSQYENQILLYGIISINAIFKEYLISVPEIHILDGWTWLKVSKLSKD